MIIFSDDDFKDAIDDIASHIEIDGWKPDVIIGMVRGGAIPAVYLSHRLKVPVTMLHISTRDFAVISKEIYQVVVGNRGKNILFVDDIIDSGHTMQIVLDNFNYMRYNDTMKIACLIYNKSQPIKADYYHHIIDRDTEQRWIKFPWE